MDTKDYRQVVSDRSITSSKSFNDFLYGWLVVHSEEGQEGRFVLKRSFVFSKMENELGMTRKTLAKYFDYLVEVGLVIEVGDKWVLVDLKDKGFWVETEILKRLVELRRRYVISTYVYLVKGYWASGKTQLIILLKNIKEYMGIGVNTDSNNYLITDLFETFREMGLLNCQLWYDSDTGKRFYKLSGVGKTNYF